MAELRNKFHKTWNTISHLDTIAGIAGMGKTVMSIIVSALLAMIAYIEQLPISYIALIALITFTSTIWAINGILWWSSQQKKVNGSFVNKHTKLSWPMIVFFLIVLMMVVGLLINNSIFLQTGKSYNLSSHPTSTPSALKPIIVDNSGIIPSFTKGFGTTGAKIGSIAENDDSKHIGFGDDKYNKEWRGFISFDLSIIPKNVKIYSAELYLDINTLGELNQDFFNTILLEAINLRNNLDIDDYNDMKVITKKEMSFDEFKSQPIRVEKEINELLGNKNKKIITFRFRFSEGTDKDNKADKIFIDSNCCKTMLLVRFKPVN